jgi:acyl carrier protein
LNRIPLPAYPFAKDSYWISADETHSIEIPGPQHLLRADKLTQIQTLCTQYAAAIIKTDASKIDLTASLTELGFDSIAFKDYSVKLEQFFKSEINPALFFTHNTIEAISKYLLETLPEHAAWMPVSHTKKTAAPIKQVSQEPIAIVGMNGYFPQSATLDEFWNHLI